MGIEKRVRGNGYDKVAVGRERGRSRIKPEGYAFFLQDFFRLQYPMRGTEGKQVFHNEPPYWEKKNSGQLRLEPVFIEEKTEAEFLYLVLFLLKILLNQHPLRSPIGELPKTVNHFFLHAPCG